MSILQISEVIDDFQIEAGFGDSPYIERWGLPAVQADMSHLDDVLKLSRLFFHFGSKEEGG